MFTSTATTTTTTNNNQQPTTTTTTTTFNLQPSTFNPPRCQTSTTTIFTICITISTTSDCKRSWGFHTNQPLVSHEKNSEKSRFGFPMNLLGLLENPYFMVYFEKNTRLGRISSPKKPETTWVFFSLIICNDLLIVDRCAARTQLSTSFLGGWPKNHFLGQIFRGMGHLGSRCIQTCVYTGGC